MRWENNHLSIASSLSNIYDENYLNREMFAQVTAKNVRDVFLRHSVVNGDCQCFYHLMVALIP